MAQLEASHSLSRAIRNAADDVGVQAGKAEAGDNTALSLVGQMLKTADVNGTLKPMAAQLAWNSVSLDFGEALPNLGANGKLASIEFTKSPSKTIVCEAAKDWACERK